MKCLSDNRAPWEEQLDYPVLSPWLLCETAAIPNNFTQSMRVSSDISSGHIDRIYVSAWISFSGEANWKEVQQEQCVDDNHKPYRTRWRTEPSFGWKPAQQKSTKSTRKKKQVPSIKFPFSKHTKNSKVTKWANTRIPPFRTWSSSEPLPYASGICVPGGSMICRWKRNHFGITNEIAENDNKREIFTCRPPKTAYVDKIKPFFSWHSA